MIPVPLDPFGGMLLGPPPSEPIPVTVVLIERMGASPQEEADMALLEEMEVAHESLVPAKTIGEFFDVARAAADAAVEEWIARFGGSLDRANHFLRLNPEKVYCGPGGLRYERTADLVLRHEAAPGSGRSGKVLKARAVRVAVVRSEG